MLGHTVYRYLSRKFENRVFAAERTNGNDPKIFILQAENIEENFNPIIQNTTDIEYVINCIGALRKNENDMFYINGEFPQKLSLLCEKHKIKLIHVSTDAVFSPLSGSVTEKDTPNPEDNYGKSKLMGEPKENNCITIRTSFIGFDAKKHKGLLEWVLSKKNQTINGYVNQNWSGCTTLQFARLCEDIIVNKKFLALRELSAVFHFVPLGPTTKYEIINEFLEILNLKINLLKKKGVLINRKLASVYLDSMYTKKYYNNIKNALEELIVFESEKTL